MEEISLGDFVLAGGEVAAMALIEACVRLIPGVLGATPPPPRRVSSRDCWNIRSLPGPRPSKGPRSRPS